MSLNVDVKTAKVGFWHMPKTFYIVVLIECWERFAFYGMQAVSVIYFVQKFGLTEAHADNILGSFSALLYAMLTIGGMIGDKILGLRRTYVLGIIFLALGYAVTSMADQPNLLYLGMAIILVGNIFFKTNANNYISRCFESNDPRLDSAFTYFYMAINLGGLISAILVPIVAQAYSYTAGLGLCSLGMLIALITYFIFREHFKSSDNQVGKNSKNMWVKLLFTLIVALFVVFLFSYMLNNLVLSKFVLYIVSISILIVYLFIASRLNHYEAKGMYLALLLILITVIFWILYIQVFTSITFFALHNIQRNFFNYEVPPGISQGLSSFFIIMLSPVLANSYIMLYKRDIKIGIPVKFVTGILATGLCFIVLAVSANFFADAAAKVSVIWLAIAYVFYALGELLVSALGASMVAQLLPKRFGGFAQGVWYLAAAIGIKTGSQLSGLAAADHNGSMDNFVILHSYISLFYKLGGAAIILALLLFFTVRPITKIMAQVLEHKY